MRLLTIVIVALTLLCSTCLAKEKSSSDISKAQATIEKDRQDRVKKCNEALQKVLKEHRCQIDVGILITPKGNIPQVQLLPLD